ncbi:MAG: hypothetical protein ACSHX8_12415 [Opitutaceae bacterium]
MKFNILILKSLMISSALLLSGCASTENEFQPKDRYSISIYGFQQPSDLRIEINGEFLLNGRYDYHAGSGLSGGVVYYHEKGEGLSITALGEVGTYTNGDLDSRYNLKQFDVTKYIHPEEGHYIEIGRHGNDSKILIKQSKEYPGYL